jgi:hypothetical protein
MAVRVLIAAALSCNLLVPTSANEFLKHPPHHAAIERISEQDVRTSLLDEVESSLGEGTAKNRLSQLESTLAPIVAALPKNIHGNLEHSAVRYALHRLFVLRHGWVIKGLGSDADAATVSSPTGLLKDQVPAYVEALFEQRLAGRGLGPHEVAVLAATIEHLVHNEAVSKLGAAFNVHSLPLFGPLAEEDAGGVLDTYMMGLILSENLDNMTLDDAIGIKQEMPEIFLAWRDTQEFVHGIRKNVTGNEDITDFASLAKAAEVVGEQFGSFQDKECKELKEKLMQMEYRGSGRVKLADFYKPALNGSWTFTESVGYLRSLGALDESEENHPSVMIANYVTSHANCIASSGFYSVCCKNECEGLLGHLEQNIGNFEAKPEAIAELVENLPSSTIPFPQKLSSSLSQRLQDIAATHGGKVPLHGRLFAQFMHHVYPRECPYPHISGTTDFTLADEFIQKSGSDAAATDEEMMQYVALSRNTTNSVLSDLSVEDVMPWSTEEELIVVRPVMPLATASTPASLRSAALLAAAGSLAFGLIQKLKEVSLLAGDEATPAKYMV